MNQAEASSQFAQGRAASPAPTAEDVSTLGDRLGWLTPFRCRCLLGLVLVLGFAAQLLYLTRDCPIDLSGDEAQYWDWSRRLDLSYYSKGPLVALIIRGSCAVFGDTMPAVRLPAVVLGMGTSLVAYVLTRLLFGSDRLALGAVLLNALVPMFVAGSMLMTIDPPYVFCWACATLCGAAAVFRGKRWAWVVAAVFVGIGFLAKYAMLLWWPCVLVALLADPTSRRNAPWRWIALGFVVSLMFTAPVVVWNARHDWVSFAHVAKQTGAADAGRFRGNTIEFVASQVGAVGPAMFALIVGAVVSSLRPRPGGPPRAQTVDALRAARFLALIGLAFWGFNLLDSFFTKVQANWPAPAYFTLTILAAYFIATRLRSAETWRVWRGWFWAAVVLGLAFWPVVRDSSIVLPIVRPVARAVNAVAGRPLVELGNLDLMERLRGWKALGAAVDRERHRLASARGLDAADVLVICDDYQQTALTAFYVSGQPETYCAGPYFGKRLSQYDMWPDRRLHDNAGLLGRDAVYVGKGGALPDVVRDAFDRVERLDPIPVVVRGVEVKSHKLWRCHGFRGMPARNTNDY